MELLAKLQKRFIKRIEQARKRNNPERRERLLERATAINEQIKAIKEGAN